MAQAKFQQKRAAMGVLIQLSAQVFQGSGCGAPGFSVTPAGGGDWRFSLETRVSSFLLVSRNVQLAVASSAAKTSIHP
jgi:hypothetical protein